jgi:hypothetical protein
MTNCLTTVKSFLRLGPVWTITSGTCVGLASGAPTGGWLIGPFTDAIIAWGEGEPAVYRAALGVRRGHPSGSMQQLDETVLEPLAPADPRPKRPSGAHPASADAMGQPQPEG